MRIGIIGPVGGDQLQRTSLMLCVEWGILLPNLDRLVLACRHIICLRPAIPASIARLGRLELKPCVWPQLMNLLR